MSHYFESVEFENFGPIKSAKLALTRLHALIGPNDSGKSWTLLGLQEAALLGAGRRPGASRLAALKNGLRIEYREGTQLPKNWSWVDAGTSRDMPPEWARNDWGPARMLRLDPDDLRQPHELIPEDKPLDFTLARGSRTSTRGLGLGAVLDAIFSRDPAARDEIQRSVVSLFPTVASFRFFTQPNGRQVGVRLKSGVEVAPEQMSEGMLYFLAFIALKHLTPTPLLLVEEPENGLHPARIADVVKVLREVSKTTQVVMATHSPLVVNELQPDEVTLVTRTESEGTKFTPIASTPNFQRRSSAFALGELWLSYADGVTEAPIFEDVKATGTK